MDEFELENRLDLHTSGVNSAILAAIHRAAKN